MTPEEVGMGAVLFDILRELKVPGHVLNSRTHITRKMKNRLAARNGAKRGVLHQYNIIYDDDCKLVSSCNILMHHDHAHAFIRNAIPNEGSAYGSRKRRRIKI